MSLSKAPDDAHSHREEGLSEDPGAQQGLLVVWATGEEQWWVEGPTVGMNVHCLVHNNPGEPTGQRPRAGRRRPGTWTCYPMFPHYAL